MAEVLERVICMSNVVAEESVATIDLDSLGKRFYIIDRSLTTAYRLIVLRVVSG